MPLGVDNIIQRGSFAFEGTSGTVTLPAPTTAGSLVMILAGASGNGVTIGATINGASGGAGSFTGIVGTGGTRDHASTVAFVQTNVAAGETSWTLTANQASQVEGTVYELWGVGVAPADKYWAVSGSQAETGLASTITTAQAPPNTGDITENFDAWAIALFTATSADTTVPTLSGYTDGFYEDPDQPQQTRANATWAMSFGVAFRSLQEVGAFTCTASVSPNCYLASGMVILYADAGAWVPNYASICGMEFGTATGLTSGSTAITAPSTAPFDAAVGTPEIVSTFKRSGSWALKLSSSAAAENVTNTFTGTLGDKSLWSVSRALVQRKHFYFDTTLPGSDVELFSVECGSLANGMTITYRTASQKIGVKIGTGTEVLSDAVVAVNKWVGVDWRYDMRTTTHIVDWQVDYDSLDVSVAPVAQTTVTQTGMTAMVAGNAGTTITSRTGWHAATTATVYYDDFAASWYWGTYPIGDVRIVPLGVDQTGTPTITGTTTNFQTFASNGTGTAWNANTARAAIAEVPPVIGASANGVMQVTAAATNFITVPMETYDCAGAAVPCTPRAVRWYVAGWAASTSVATLNIKNDDGVNQLVDIGLGAGALDHNFDSSTLVWLCAMHRFWNFPGETSFYQLTQSRVDGLFMNVGYSTDATPDVGVHSILAELCVAPAKTYGVVEAAADSGTAYLYVRADPVTKSVVSLVATTPPGAQGATILTTIGGVDGTHYVPPNTTFELPVGASSVADVTGYGLLMDPTA
jgi:hypothetical protein